MLRKGCGRMAVDNSCTRITGEESEHPPLTSCSQNSSLLQNRKSGQLICYKTGQFYLLLTEFFKTEMFGFLQTGYSHLFVDFVSNPGNFFFEILFTVHD
jgi:hypothetical protein